MLKNIKEAAIEGDNVDPAVRTGFLLTLLVTSIMVGIYVSRKVKRRLSEKDRSISSADGLQSEEDEEEWEEI